MKERPILFSAPMVRATFVLEETGTEYEARRPTDGRPWKECEDGTILIPHYRATDAEPHIVPWDRIDGDDDRTRWTPSIFMPRWASRITLEVASVRLERLHAITEDDARAEGFPSPPGANVNYPDRARYWFQSLWESINGAGSWAKNPRVWVVEFKRLDGKLEASK